MIKVIKELFSNQCPKCSKGKIFMNKNTIFKIGFPKMHSKCESCNYKFEREPGFFFGAMYVGYGLTVMEVLFTYLITRLFFEQALDLRMIPIILAVIISLIFFNFRLSRIIWIYMFRNS